MIKKIVLTIIWDVYWSGVVCGILWLFGIESTWDMFSLIFNVVVLIDITLDNRGCYD